MILLILTQLDCLQHTYFLGKRAWLKKLYLKLQGVWNGYCFVQFDYIFTELFNMKKHLEWWSESE